MILVRLVADLCLWLVCVCLNLMSPLAFQTKPNSGNKGRHHCEIAYIHILQSSGSTFMQLEERPLRASAMHHTRKKKK